MSFLQTNFAAMLIGLAMDSFIGDPEGWPHPVIWIGRSLARAQALRK